MFHARAFGSAVADAEIDFGGADRVSVVTSVLAACLTDEHGQPLDDAQIWDWTLNRRLHALIAVRLAAGDAVVELQTACAHCGEAMLLELDLRALCAEPAAPRFGWRDEGGRELTLRLPRGRDVQHWMREEVDSPEAIAAALVEAVDGQPARTAHTPDGGWLAALGDAFEAHDPLATLRLHASCPACGRANTVACDLEQVLLAGFARAQAALLDEVLRLAPALHWSEPQILALPRWRRAYYLRRLDAGGLA